MNARAHKQFFYKAYNSQILSYSYFSYYVPSSALLKFVAGGVPYVTTAICTDVLDPVKEVVKSTEPREYSGLMVRKLSMFFFHPRVHMPKHRSTRHKKSSDLALLYPDPDPPFYVLILLNMWHTFLQISLLIIVAYKYLLLHAKIINAEYTPSNVTRMVCTLCRLCLSFLLSF